MNSQESEKFNEAYSAIAERLEETSSPSNQFETNSRILNFIVDFVRDNGCEYRDEIEPLVRKLYNDYVRPFDIPGIPNLVIERKVDDAIEEVLVRVSKRVIRRICDGMDNLDDTDDDIIISEG